MVSQAGAGEGLTRTYELREQLGDDVARAFQELERDKASQFRRRATVRAVFSYLDGAVSILKFELGRELRRSSTEHPALSKSEGEFLNERQRPDGSFLSLHFSLETSIKTSFRLAAKVWDIDFRLDTAAGRKDLSAARVTRNRLSHPKTYYDLQITDAEMSSLAAAYLWFKEQFARLWRVRVEDLAASLPAEAREALIGR